MNATANHGLRVSWIRKSKLTGRPRGRQSGQGRHGTYKWPRPRKKNRKSRPLEDEPKHKPWGRAPRSCTSRRPFPWQGQSCTGARRTRRWRTHIPSPSPARSASSAAARSQRLPERAGERQRNARTQTHKRYREYLSVVLQQYARRRRRTFAARPVSRAHICSRSRISSITHIIYTFLRSFHREREKTTRKQT